MPFNVQGDLVYVNYGRVEDFMLLRDRGINFTGLICIARNGKLFRGNKVRCHLLYSHTKIYNYTDAPCM